jgi:hypothetical protein
MVMNLENKHFHGCIQSKEGLMNTTPIGYLRLLTTQGNVPYMYLEFSAAQVKICNIKTIRTIMIDYYLRAGIGEQ